MKNKKPTWLTPGVYIGIRDKYGKEIHLGDFVKILIGKPNNGYKVTYEDGAFCFSGGQVGTCSFIKFRDELINAQITGKVVTDSFQDFLELVDERKIPNGTGAEYRHFKGPSGGNK